MSLFDPATTQDEARLFEYGPDGSASGEPIPELSDSRKEQLKRKLLKAGVEIARSANHEDGWEDAYAAFAETFQQAGGRLTEAILSLDIPNMLFNFALANSWFPHLTAMLTETEVTKLTSPMRVAWDTFSNKNRDGRYVYEQSKEESIIWFRKRIRPAVMEWVAIAAEEQTKCEAEHTKIMEIVRRELPSPDATPKRTPAEIIDEYLEAAKVDGIAFTQAGLAREATKIGNALPQEDRATITAVSVSRIYHRDNLGSRIRYCVAMAINKKLPCTADDLLWPEGDVRNDYNSPKVVKKRITWPRNRTKSH